MLNKILSQARQRTLFPTAFSKLINRRDGVSWQIRKGNSSTKFDLIRPILREQQIRSVLDVGCNAGIITRLAGEEGLFSVGVDGNVDFRGVVDPLNGACIGNIEMNSEMIDKLPRFDAILLLSVHHQFVAKFGDIWTQNFVFRLANKADKVFFIEFAALNSKYSATGNSLFIDNDDASVVSYARNWLAHALPSWDINYIGKVPESKTEPFRFMFFCTPP